MKFRKEDAPPSEEEKKKKEEEEEEKTETEKSAAYRIKKEGEEEEVEEAKEEVEEAEEELEEKKDELEEAEEDLKEAAKSAPTGFVKAADLDAIIKSAIAPLRAQIEKQTTQIRKSELEYIVKSDLDGIGKTTEVADALFQIEKSNLPNSTKDSIYKMLKSAAVVKKEAGKYLFNPMGANLPAPGSAAEEFEGLVKKEMTQIRKSADAPTDQKILRAQAVKKVSLANPVLVSKYQAEEKAASYRDLMGGI